MWAFNDFIYGPPVYILKLGSTRPGNWGLQGTGQSIYFPLTSVLTCQLYPALTADPLSKLSWSCHGKIAPLNTWIFTSSLFKALVQTDWNFWASIQNFTGRESEWPRLGQGLTLNAWLWPEPHGTHGTHIAATVSSSHPICGWQPTLQC